MKNKIYFLLILLQISCNNKGQNKFTFDKMPLDTTKWCATDTILIDLNQDGIKDMILVFDKYRGMVRPGDIQTPILFYLGTETKDLKLIKAAYKIIYLPYELEIIENSILMIRQKGIKTDRNIYTNLYKYENDNIYLIKELVVEKITRSVIDEVTEEVKTINIQIDTLINKIQKIPVEEYDFRNLYQRFLNE